MGLRLAGYLKGGPIQDVAIYQNTVVRCGFWGGAWENSGLLVEAQNPENRNFNIRNNIFAGNVDQISTKKQAYLTLDRNLLHGPTQVKGDNALVADPLFVNAREHDFRLAAGSPAIDAALGEPLSTSDHADQARPLPGNAQSKAVADVGAFEWSPAAPGTTPPPRGKVGKPAGAGLPAASGSAVAKPPVAPTATEPSAAPAVAKPAAAAPLLGKIKPRSAKEIASSSWSIGGETLDRDFAVYANYKQFLGPLGAKHIRLQAGWAKCEKTPGVYDWAWLDEIVNDALAQGVQPWIETSYGNPIYPGGGGTGLGAGLPKSPEALQAWDAWVKALVAHFKDRVHEWEVWNEPDGGHGITEEGFAEFHLRTAAIIRAEQPQARIFALALASPGKTQFVEVLLKLATERGQLGLIDAINIHGYPPNPDDTGVALVRRVVARYSPTIEVRQGETGCAERRDGGRVARDVVDGSEAGEMGFAPDAGESRQRRAVQPLHALRTQIHAARHDRLQPQRSVAVQRRHDGRRAETRLLRRATRVFDFRRHAGTRPRFQVHHALQRKAGRVRLSSKGRRRDACRRVDERRPAGGREQDDAGGPEVGRREVRGAGVRGLVDRQGLRAPARPLGGRRRCDHLPTTSPLRLADPDRGEGQS